MPITYIPSPITESLERFGLALGDRLAGGPEKRRLEAFQANPERAQNLVPIARQAERNGKFGEFAEGLGLNEEDARTLFLEGLQPTPEQVIQETFVAGGGLQQVAHNQIQQAVVNGMSLDQAIKTNLPILEADARAAGAELEGETAEYQLGLLRYRQDTGIDFDSIDQELEQLGLQQGAIEGFKSYRESLPEDSEERRFIDAALVSPAVANTLLQLRNQDISALMRRMTLQQTSEEDKLALSFELADRLNAAVDRLAEAEEKGLDEDFIEQAKQNLENARLLTQNFVEMGKALPFALTGVEGKEGKIELTFHDITSSNLDAISREADAMIEEGATVEEIQAEVQAALESGLLSPAEREALEKQSETFIQKLQDRAREGEGTILGGLTELGRQGLLAGPATRGPALATGAIISETMNLINQLGDFLGATGEAIRSADPNRQR